MRFREIAARHIRWKPVDGSGLEPTVDFRRYRCLEPCRLYRYEAVDRSFSADLPVDEDGVVLDYPTLFDRIPPA